MACLACNLLRIELFLALGGELGLTVQPRTPRATGPTGRASEFVRRNFEVLPTDLLERICRKKLLKSSSNKPSRRTLVEGRMPASWQFPRVPREQPTSPRGPASLPEETFQVLPTNSLEQVCRKKLSKVLPPNLLDPTS